MAISRNNKAEIHAAIGASGSGKTTWVMSELQRLKPKRLMIWDTKGEFAREGYAQPVTRLQDVVSLVTGQKAFKVAFQPWGDDKRMHALFDIFCMAAFQAKNLVLVAEELSDVTLPSRAVAGWRRCTSQGRSEGITIYGLTQRPASVDKHFFGNCSTIRCGRLNYAQDVAVMANALRVEKLKIEAIRSHQWIRRDLFSGKLEFGG
ncbi:hypothetical protein [Chitinivorax sp. B]|uniref:hypothetical protein n=1 Tax=Chitinivorax sp. B TaxID=2502235 RepID=UPI0010F8B1BB|nr:hypothetical protein [Chitinivorax sp. B]